MAGTSGFVSLFRIAKYDMQIVIKAKRIIQHKATHNCEVSKWPYAASVVTTPTDDTAIHTKMTL